MQGDHHVYNFLTRRSTSFSVLMDALIGVAVIIGVINIVAVETGV
jgi:hypothetical protein